MGRRHIQDPDYTPEMVDAICEAIRQGGSIEAACWQYRISPSRLARWRKTYLEFDEMIKDSLAFSIGWFHNNIKENLSNRNYNANAAMMYARLVHKQTEDAKLVFRTRTKGKNRIDRMQEIYEGLLDGEIAPSQSIVMTNVLLAEAKIEEQDTIRNRIEQLEKLQGIE